MIKILEYKHSGFTLIEIIITLVIAAVVGTGLAQYLGTAFTTSAIPIQHLRQAFELQQVMENITEDYENDPTALLDNEETNESGLQSKIDNKIYGDYDVVFNNFIEFYGQNPLKVTIMNESGRITTLFTSQ